MSRSELVHGLFSPVEAQIAYWREKLSLLHEQRVLLAGLEFFLAMNPEPEWPKERIVAVALTLHAPTAVQEFQLYWPLIGERQAKNWKWNQFIFNDAHVRHFQCKEQAWRWSWGVIDLGANRNTTTDTVRHRASGTLPGAEILAAGALHPEWVRLMNGDDIPFVLMPGYEVSIPGGSVWRSVPGLDFGCGGLVVRLSVYWYDGANPRWGVPVFVRE